MQHSASPAGRRRKQFRAAVRGVLGDSRHGGVQTDESRFVALVEEPYSDPEETNRRLQDLLTAFENHDDRRAVFLTIYARMTREVADGVHRGTFENPDWVADYLVSFANLYREAVLAYETGRHDSLADPWQLAFDAAKAEDSLVLQDAVLGVNAHINYDLAYALDDVGIDEDPETKFEDHSTVTAVIESVIDDAQASLIERDADGIGRLDGSLGRLDEWLAVQTIDECRDSAWRTARALQSRFNTRQQVARWINETTATGTAHLILSSKTSDLIHERLQALETGSEADQ